MPARPTAVAVDIGRVLRTAAGVHIPEVAARITVVEAEEAPFAPAVAATMAAAGVAVPASAGSGAIAKLM